MWVKGQTHLNEPTLDRQTSCTGPSPHLSSGRRRIHQLQWRPRISRKIAAARRQKTEPNICHYACRLSSALTAILLIESTRITSCSTTLVLLSFLLLTRATALQLQRVVSCVNCERCYGGSPSESCADPKIVSRGILLTSLFNPHHFQFYSFMVLKPTSHLSHRPIFLFFLCIFWCSYRECESTMTGWSRHFIYQTIYSRCDFVHSLQFNLMRPNCCWNYNYCYSNDGSLWPIAILYRPSNSRSYPCKRRKLNLWYVWNL